MAFGPLVIPLGKKKLKFSWFGQCIIKVPNELISSSCKDRRGKKRERRGGGGGGEGGAREKEKERAREDRHEYCEDVYRPS